MEQQQQQQVLISKEDISQMMGDKDFAFLSAQALNKQLVNELKRLSEENAVLKAKLAETGTPVPQQEKQEEQN